MKRALLSWYFVPAIALAADALPEPMAAQPPEPRPLQLQLAPVATNHTLNESDSAALAEDVKALRKAVERVRAAVAETTDEKTTAKHGEHGAEGEKSATSHDGGTTAHGSTAHGAEQASTHETTGHTDASAKPTGHDGPRRPSLRFGERLTVQTMADGSQRVHCALEREPVELVYRELGKLLGMPVDDTQAIATRRVISAHLTDVPWDDALDRLLGQVGVAWRAEGHGAVQTLVIFDREQSGNDALMERLAGRALAQAAQAKDPVAAAEAMWLTGAQQAAAKRWLEAMRIYTNLADRFGQNKDTAVRHWVLKAIKGVGDAMMQMRQYADARSVYDNFISRADDLDPELPSAYLASAEAGRRLGGQTNDPMAYDQAIDVLHAMLEKFADKPAAAAEVNMARLALGELMVDAGRWREAETQLSLFAKSGAGGPPPDQLAYWLAECAFNLGRVDEARALYERLYRTWRSAKGEVPLSQELYRTAALRIGQCWLHGKEPRWVNALFAFLRARQDFLGTPMGPEIAVAIARCYSELNRDEEAIDALMQLIKQDARDQRPGSMQLDQLLGELESGLSSYPGPIRGRVLFYMAQAEYRRAQRDRKVRKSAAEESMAHYERVLAENPGPELGNATRLGLARAAFLAGQDRRGELVLSALMHERTLDARDRAMASQILGTHLRERGKLREAIQAFRGEIAE